MAALDMHCFVEWLWAPGNKPPRSGKYVVEIDCGKGLCYLSTRSYNAEAGGMWLGMTDGESVGYWLDGLKWPADLVRELNLVDGLNTTNFPEVPREAMNEALRECAGPMPDVPFRAPHGK